MNMKKSAPSHDEAALLGKKYHIAAKIMVLGDMHKDLDCFFNFFTEKKVRVVSTGQLF